MAKIKVTSKCELYDGMSITFKAPCDCTAITGLNVYYNNTVQSFAFRDAHGNDLSTLGNLFSTGVYVKTVLDTRNGFAYLQNADTNGYLESQFSGKAPTVHTHDDRYYTETESLSDSTRSAFGLSASAVPNDVLSFLGKYNLHTWKRRTAALGFIVSTTPTTGYFMGKNTNNIISYSTELLVDASGNASLKNPSTVTIMCNDNGVTAVKNNLLGKYVTGLRSSNTSTTTLSGVYYVPSNATIDTTASNYYAAYTTVYEVTYDFIYGETLEYVRSTDRNTYPDSGVSGGYDYEYLGIPFGNAVTAPKFATGSYVGTGTSGSSNPNTLSFPFVPKVFMLSNGTFKPDQRNNAIYVGFEGGFIWFYGMEETRTISGSASVDLLFTQSDKSISWYADTYSDSYSPGQCNVSGTTYTWIAIG